ncbi:sensor histidine kinase [Clostridium beijerinckii]|uniref:histidine kinase n=1 Tax=Clostridium beijerinckii TaxID=1520 RepID=A0AAX0B6Z9_CLOBE|nr:HAMP domain-containing sensor histidine kinase [Clostridium beijerinckii]NRT91172.1 two-component system OmpR family sensor kinase [Clostridium beijerinckii]NYC70698.1 two-component system OmpR family sensor kinase [Clostridium beijerinckii]
MKKLRNKLKIKSLKWQLLFRFLVILILLLGIMGLFQYISMKNYLYKTKVQVLHERFHNLDFKKMSKENMEDITESDTKEILKNLWDKNMSVALINKNGELLGQRSNIDTPRDDDDGDDDSKEPDERKRKEIPVPVLSRDKYIEICNEQGNLEHTYEVVRDENNNYQMVAWIKVGDLDSPSGLIQLSTPIDDITSILDRQEYVHISLSIMILIVGTILGITIFNRTLKPLYNITDTVEGISVTDLHTRLTEESGQLEINRLSKSFNIMLERIETSFEKEQIIKEKMRRFVSDASHELRTPLTSIHGFVEVLLRGAAKNQEKLDLALNSILMESERLAKLVNDLLILTRLDQQPVVEIKKENLNDVINEIIPQLQILSKDRTLNIELKDYIDVYINKNQIKQVIFNMAQNAVIHTDKEKGVITISIGIEDYKNKTFAVLKISDNGTGIPKEHLDKIYDRFFRSDSHRAREQGGYGLGLSIVKSIIDSNRGKIRVESELGVGTTFSIYLKLENKADGFDVS